MAKTDDLSRTYLRFLSLASAIRDLPTFPPLDVVEEGVLNSLATVWGRGAKVTVLEAMQLSANTSPTTVHRRLKTLREKGLIDLREDEADNRIKYVMPTDTAKAYFAQMGQCLDRAMRERLA